MESFNSPGLIDLTELDTFYAVTQLERLSIWFFDADWCGPCRLVHVRYRHLAEHYGVQVLFYRVDVDDVPEICEALHVQQIPKTFAYRMGEVLDWPWPGFSAATTQEEYQSWIDRHL